MADSMRLQAVLQFVSEHGSSGSCCFSLKTSDKQAR